MVKVDMFSRFDAIPACERRTDRHLATDSSRYAHASRGNRDTHIFVY